MRSLRPAPDVPVGRPVRVTIALATCAAFPDGDGDDRLLTAALPEARFAVWDDPAVDWAAFDLVVIRSTWDYQDRHDAFLAWARSVPRLVNPAEVIAWNTDKRYLAEVPGAVDTTFVARGGAFAAPAGEYVVKPSVSAGTRDTARFGPGEDARARALVQRIHASGRTAMVQPYLGAVDELGETALLFFDGAFSHAIRKGPLLTPGADPHDDVFAAEDIEPRDPPPGERELAERVVAHVRGRFGDLAYARVDVVPGPGGPQLLELELTEPSLFFAQGDGAAERFAVALRSRVG
jgi:glutathione synthase/RimK-type ligase-like ATP-grasp enzyme